MKKFLLLAFYLVLSAAIATGQEFPAPMQPPRLVNDFSGILTQEQQDGLERKLVDFADTSSTQIAVVTVNDLHSYDVSDYAARLFDSWGIGGKEHDNGILILVKPKTPDALGQVFISTGYGIEGVIPDILAGRIVDYDMIPYFREDRYYEGINKAVDTIIELAAGEYTAEQYVNRHEDGVHPGMALFVLFLIIIIVTFIVGIIKGGGNGTISSGRGGGIPPIIFGSGRSSGGGFGGFSGGGGGFGGFGGGSTGGGGAGGSW